MFTELVFITVTAVILYSLINLTEKTLVRRPQPAEKDVRILDHRSRM
jgi:hypothetical protein